MRADTDRPVKITRPRVEFKTTPNHTMNVLTDKDNCYTTEAYLAVSRSSCQKGGGGNSNPRF